MNTEVQAQNYDDELSNEELNSMYSEGEMMDKGKFAEFRSNLRMISGQHYNNEKRKYFVNRIREQQNLTDSQKLRLTKNHTGKIFSLYVNNIVSNTPGLTILPNNKKEIQDQKSADLNRDVWERAVVKHKLRGKFRNFAKDFCGMGECALRLIWDPNKGDLVGYEPKMERLDVPGIDEQGNIIEEIPVYDQMGQEVPDYDRPVFSGEFVFKRIEPYNLIRPKQAKNIDEAAWLCEREMMDIGDLKKIYRDDPEKIKIITESQDETFLMFDGHQADYRVSKKETLILSFFFRPCMKYPKGYFIIKTLSGILEQGELPEGIFPIVYQNWDQHDTNPRGRSKFVDGKPYQIEINRCASSIATHQVTLGPDKLIGNTMGKIEHSAIIPGVQFIKLNSGGELKHLPGRTGDQYVPYMNSQIQEYYSVMMLPEEAIDKESVSGDAFASLFKSLKQKKKFSMYVEKFEEFMVETCKLYLRMAKIYLPDEELIVAIGNDEIVNIEEFRNSEEITYQIKIEPGNSDLETQYGQQLVLNQALQYVGSSLDKQSIGKLLKSMPFANVEDVISDFVMDEENADNLILALERGDQPVVSRFDDNLYMMSKLVHRMRKPDFKYLSPEIQDAFEQYYEAFNEQEVAKQEELQRAQSGYIPTGGYGVKADFYVEEDGKTKRVELPSESIDWLLKKLADQGSSQEAMSRLNPTAQLDIAAKLNDGMTQYPQ